jgi:predicted AAA+ superfamily ATPase
MADKSTIQKVNTYRPRIADTLLFDALRTSGATQIVGPKWCGKTTTAEQVAKEVIYFQDPDKRESYRQIAIERPSLLLKGEKPLLLDEWQDAPQMWDAVRFAVDKEQAVGQYILTGSTVSKDDDAIRHSGTGRFSRLRMRPMSLFESGESNGCISLTDLFDGQDVYGKTDLSLEHIAYLLARGGWPASVILNDEYVISRANDYVESIAETDISKVDGIEKNPKRVRLLMRSLARNESTGAAMTTLKSDMRSEDNGRLSTNTIAIYLNALRRLYVLEEQEAWAQAVRSKVTIRTSPVRRFCDPSVAASLLRFTPDKMLVDYSTFGLLFESLCVRDLRTYAEAIDGEISFYRDARDLDCDAIIELADGRWAAVEIKLEQNLIPKAAETLKTIKTEVKSQHGGEATFLMILTNGDIGYRREDGIYVIPIGCLKP